MHHFAFYPRRAFFEGLLELPRPRALLKGRLVLGGFGKRGCVSVCIFVEDSGFG